MRKVLLGLFAGVVGLCCWGASASTAHAQAIDYNLGRYFYYPYYYYPHNYWPTTSPP
jgi:hypothetical protein